MEQIVLFQVTVGENPGLTTATCRCGQEKKPYFVFLAVAVGLSETLHTDSILRVHVNSPVALAEACTLTLNNRSTQRILNHHLAYSTVKDPIAAGICHTRKEMGLSTSCGCHFSKHYHYFFLH